MPRVQQKRGTAANLTSVNPTPLAGELLVVTDENTLVIGNGSDSYTSLAYVTATPRSHKSTHATGGSDALSPSDIGAAPAASPTFTGTVTVPGLTSTGQILADDSTSTSAPVYSFDGDANCGIAHPAADTVAISTAGAERVRVRSDGNVGIGGAGSSTSPLAISSPLTGGTVVNGVYANPTIGSDVTIAASVFRTFVGTAAASFTLPTLIHFNCTANTFGAGSTVTSQIGFYAGSSLTGATANVGFRGDIADGANRWNFYALGTAPNYFAGNVGIATTSPTEKLDINSDKIRLRTAKTPASSSDTGNTGDICWDASYLYICTATDTWRRIAHSTW